MGGYDPYPAASGSDSQHRRGLTFPQVTGHVPGALVRVGRVGLEPTTGGL